MDTGSISNSLSKGSLYESESICNAYRDDAMSRLADGLRPEVISNEQIHKGDVILETYTVRDNAIDGGMGSVWRVHHGSWNTDLAMKRPQPRFFSEGSERRKALFIDECEHWINLGLHPNIVSCYYVREIGGVPTIFSEWMDGGSLKDAIRSGRLYDGTKTEVQARLLDVAIQTVRGLRYSHENGLVHQDVKPENILMTGDWDTKVADFGLAKAQSRLHDGDRPVSTGCTLQYCPGEQAEGAPAEAWMDIYAWAVTVLEMYAGERLWDTGGEVQARFREFRGRCPVDMTDTLAELLARCLTAGSEGRRELPENIEDTLTGIYREACGIPYPRKAPKAAADTADSLNNRALSFLDLGKTEDAEMLWKQALVQDAKHAGSLYNYALYRWRRCEIEDAAAVDLLRVCREDPAYPRLVSRLELERGNPEGVCSGADEADIRIAESMPPLNLCSQELPDTYGFLEISPDERLILTGGDSALLYSVSDQAVLWKKSGMDVTLGAAVDWERGELCRAQETVKERTSRDLFRSGIYDSWYQFGIYGLETGRQVRKLPAKRPPANTDRPEAFRYLENGDLFAVRSRARSGDITRYDLDHVAKVNPASGEILRRRSLDVKEYEGAADVKLILREDGGFIVLALGKEHTEIIYYPTDTWEPGKRVLAGADLRGAFRAYGDCRLTDDGNGLWLLVAAKIDELCHLDLRTGMVRTIYKQNIPKKARIAVDESNRLIALKDENAVRLLDADTGRCMRTFPITGEGTVALGKTLLAAVGKYDSPSRTLHVMQKPQFGYRGQWEISRIQSTTRRISQDDLFRAELEAEAEALRAGRFNDAKRHLDTARAIEGRQNDPEVLERMQQLCAKGGKAALRGAVPVRIVSTPAKTLRFLEDGMSMLVGMGKECCLLEIGTGKLIPAVPADGQLSEIGVLAQERLRCEALDPPANEGYKRRASCLSPSGRWLAVIDQKVNDFLFGIRYDLRIFAAWSGREEAGAGGVDWGQLAIHEGMGKSFVVISALAFTDEPGVRAEEKNRELSIAVHDISNGKVLRTLRVPMGRTFSRIVDTIISPDGTTLLVTYVRRTGRASSVCQYIEVDLTTGKKRPALCRQNDKPEDNKRERCIVYSGFQNQLVYAKDPSTVAFTPLREGDPEIVIREDFRRPTALAVSADGTWLAVAGGVQCPKVYLYQLEWEFLK